MGTGVGKIAGMEINEELLHLARFERVIGFDGVAADGFGDDLLAETALAPGFSARFLEIDKNRPEELGHGAGFDHGRKGVDEERSPAQFCHAESDPAEGVELLTEEIGLGRGQFNRRRKEQALAEGLFFGHPLEHLLEQNPFVGRVLVDEDDARLVFSDDVKIEEDADNPEVVVPWQ